MTEFEEFAAQLDKIDNKLKIMAKTVSALEQRINELEFFALDLNDIDKSELKELVTEYETSVEGFNTTKKNKVVTI